MGKFTTIYLLFILLGFLSCNQSHTKENSVQSSFPSIDSLFNILIQEKCTNPKHTFLPDSIERKLQSFILEKEYFLQPEQQFNIARNYSIWCGNDNLSLAFSAEMFGMACYNSQHTDSSISAFNKSLDLYVTIKDTAGIARSYSMLGTTAELNSEFSIAIKNQIIALGLFEQLGDSSEMMDCKIELAYLLGKRDNVVFADKLMYDAERYFMHKKDSIQLAALYYSLAEIHGDIKDYENASTFAQKSLEYRLALKDSLNLSICYNYLGYVSMANHDWEKAIKNIQLAEYIRKILGNYDEPVIKYNLAICLSKTGRSTEAIDLLLKSIQLAENDPEYLNTKSLAHLVLSEIYDENGYTHEALDYRKSYEVLKDSLDKKNNDLQFHELSLRFQNIEKEKQFEDSIHQNEQTKKYNLLLITAAGIIIILLLLSLYLVRQRNIKNVELKEEQLQNIRKELELRQEQLISFTHQLADRSRIIQEFESNTQGDKSVPVEHEDEAAFEQLLQMKILTEEDWRVFRIQFEQAFPGVMLRLHARYPFLTGAEQRIFLLIRLCSDTKEIADLLGISTESVRKAKYRLKKKLGLGENVAIDEYIRKF